VICLAGVLDIESSEAVVEPYLRMAWEVVEHWSPEAVRPELTERLADTSRRLAERAPGAGARQVALRSLARVADVPALEWLREQAGDDVELGWRRLSRLAELGGVDGATLENEIEALLARDPDPESWVRALTVRAAVPDPGAKEEFWQVAVVQRRVPIGSFSLAAQSFWRPGQEQLVAPYVERYLELLPGLDQGGMIPAMVYTRRMFPLHGIDAEFLDRAVATAQDAAPVVRQTLVERADEVRRMLAARAG
jgi:aminopeptidase N